jgi:uncharacterized short protein YbdD (DUF466 family)
MWLEICLTVVAFSQVMNMLIGFAKYYKDYVEEEEEEEDEPMSEEAKRMFN